MKIYPLTQADVLMLKDIVNLDAENGALFWKKKIAKKVVVGTRAGEDRRDGYFAFQAFGKKFLVHRVIYALVHGECTGEIDHINGNPSDNRPSNLRVVTRSQQNMNRRTTPKKDLGFKGVCLHARTGLYNARVSVNNKRVSLGYFKTREEAHAAYLTGVKKYHGEYRRAY